MKNYLKNNNGFTVKELIFTIIAIVIAFAVGFALSYIFTNNSKQYIDRISELEAEIQEIEGEGYIEDNEDTEDESEEPEEDEIISKEVAAENTLLSSYYNAIYVTAEFEYEEVENNKQSEILNYKEIMQEIFTENGQKIFEEENKSYIEIKNGKAYISANVDDTEEYLLGINMENINENENEDTITATVVRKMSKNPIDTFNDEELKDSDVYTLKNDIVLKKINDNWLVDKYSWVIKNQ